MPKPLSASADASANGYSKGNQVVARYHLSKGKKKEKPTSGGMFGCILIIVLGMLFMAWTLYLILNQG